MLLQPTVNVKIYIHFLYSYGVDASFEMLTTKKDQRDTNTVENYSKNTTQLNQKIDFLESKINTFVK